MICKLCADGGKTSKVFPIGSMTTLMSCMPYYDENGEIHHHDRNIITTSYRCSNGHMWEENSKKECPTCGPMWE
jgi:hypothetical protein